MAETIRELHGVRLLECDSDGPRIDRDRDAVDIIGAAFAARPDWIVIPVARLGPGFLDLKTRLAGEVLQKFVNYDFRVVILGDVSAAMAASKALRDFVHETNRGTQVWFVASREALAERLRGRAEAG
ncbi:MAG TPA: DUF4180 domain-containing protein [Rhizomicrobium sp.]|jgi:hypothetical protein|nr:DUF4180 domain-containing protein [Rhizomicrobium sp.]